MVNNKSLSNQHQDLSQIQTHYADVTTAIRSYYLPMTTIHVERFIGYTKVELKSELELRINEIDKSSSFSLLSAIEAAFKIDYLQRCSMKKKNDPLTDCFREIYKEKNTHASLENDILENWKKQKPELRSVISDIKGAFKYRHWIAHGRYWVPKLGNKKYDYVSVYGLAQTIFSNFDFVMYK